MSDERKGKQETLDCAICHKKIDPATLPSRIIIKTKTASFIPKTWDFCNECRKKYAKKAQSLPMAGKKTDD